MSGGSAATAPIDALYRQALARDGGGGRRVLSGRLALDALLRTSVANTGVAVHRLHSFDELREVFIQLSATVTPRYSACCPTAARRRAPCARAGETTSRFSNAGSRAG